MTKTETSAVSLAPDPEQPNMAFAVHDALSWAVHNAHMPRPDEWTAFFGGIAQHIDQLAGILVYSEGGGPDTLQLRQAGEFFVNAQRVLPVAVLTKAVATRGRVAMLPWVSPQRAAVFEPHDIGNALAFLKVEISVEQARSRLQALAQCVAVRM
jgi:hypothetical protein